VADADASHGRCQVRRDEFVAEVLPENMPMLKVFERCGLVMSTRSERGVVHVMLALAQGATEGAK
jgi:hypothetical protein